jgi:ATP-dependent Lon protease
MSKKPKKNSNVAPPAAESYVIKEDASAASSKPSDDLYAIPDRYRELEKLEKLGPPDLRRRAVFLEKIPEAGNSDHKRQMTKFERIAGPLPFHRPSGIADARKQLVTEFPYAVAIIDRILTPLAIRIGLGHDETTFEPTLIVGPPGLGKSRLARRICEALDVHYRCISVAGSHESHIFGLSRGFGSTTPAIFSEMIRDSGYPNPVIILDEIEKVSTDRRHGSIHDILLSLLEKSEAKRFHEPYFGVPVDASHVNWMFTANSLDGIPDALRSRLRVYNMRPPSVEHLPVLISGIRAELATELGLDHRWIPGLDPAEMSAVASSYAEHKSVRVLRRQVLHLLESRQMILQ